MAPLPVIADTYRVALSWTNTVNSMTATNVMHFHRAGSNPAQLATDLDAHVTNTMWECCATPWSVTGIVITKLDGGSVSFPYIPGTPAKWTGHGGAVDFAPNVAVIMKLLTAKRGRSYRGRVFLPGIAESQTDKGLVVGSTKTTMDGAWLAFRLAMTAASWDFCVASYRLATQEPIVALATEKFTATQKRRLQRNASV